MESTTNLSTGGTPMALAALEQINGEQPSSHILDSHLGGKALRAITQIANKMNGDPCDLQIISGFFKDALNPQACGERGYDSLLGGGEADTASATGQTTGVLDQFRDVIGLPIDPADDREIWHRRWKFAVTVYGAMVSDQANTDGLYDGSDVF